MIYYNCGFFCSDSCSEGWTRFKALVRAAVRHNVDVDTSICGYGFFVWRRGVSCNLLVDLGQEPIVAFVSLSLLHFLSLGMTGATHS